MAVTVIKNGWPYTADQNKKLTGLKTWKNG
jgi:hypothetical protein